jgi:hypothetical protein
MDRTYPQPSKNTRIGFYYYPDSLHYQKSDLQTWLPELNALGAQWLILDAPTDRAIPEGFLGSLLASGIEPILHFKASLANPPKPEEMAVLFDAYASWGVHYVCLFDRPNTLQAWTQETWVQQQLVSRYLDVFIPLAEQACKAGLFPVLSPLEPGGNFWDTAFLKAALKGIYQRGHTRLLSQMAIGAYAWPNDRPLDWGNGGPDVWSGARPYFTPEDEQDHLGFRIFDWYTAISEVVLGAKLPVILMGTGSGESETDLQIANLLAGVQTLEEDAPQIPAVPEHILAGCFWLLSAPAESPAQAKAWYQSGGAASPTVSLLKEGAAERKQHQAATQPTAVNGASTPADMPEKKGSPPKASQKFNKPIQHYLLLPKYEWGVADWHLEVCQPFIKKYTPTVGFSLKEARLAARVTIVGGDQSFPQQTVKTLTEAGCQVVQVSGSGTEIATQLKNL